MELRHRRRRALGKTVWAFHDHELVELGFFIGLTLGQQRWIKTLGIEHGNVLGDTAAGLAPSLEVLKGHQL